MTERLVKGISFLISEKRYYIEANLRGKFKVPSMTGTDRGSKSYKYMTPRQVIEDPRIVDGDPSLTLQSGEKIRVFQGGDPTAMLVEVDSILLLHEREYTRRSTAEKEKLKKDSQSSLEYAAGLDLSYGHDDDEW